MSFYLALVGCLAIVSILSTINPQPKDDESPLNPFFDIHPLLPDLFAFMIMGLGLFLIQAENTSGTYDGVFLFWIGIVFVLSLKSMLKIVALYFSTVRDSIERMTEWDAP